MIKIVSQDGGSETVAAEQIGTDLYKLLENPILSCRINYGTTIKATANEKGELTLSKIVRLSEFKTRQFLLSASFTESEIREKIGNPIINVRGFWEVVMGGIAYVHIPRTSDFDLDKLLKDINYVYTEIIDDLKDTKPNP